MRVGIDLGTTNSSIAYINQDGRPEIIHNREGERTTPSVLLYEEGNFVVGTVAKEESIDEPMNTVQFVKRQIGNNNFKFLTEDNKEFTPEELSAIILRRLIDDAENFLDEKVTEAVITVPAYFNDSQRKATADAGEIAGVKVLKIINEPTAAALAYSQDDTSSNQNILIYDLGGGTFDVTIVSITDAEIRTLATDGIRSLGGFDFDNALLNEIMNEFNEQYSVEIDEDEEALQELREKIEAAKKMLSARGRTNVSLNFGGHKMKTVVTLERFEAIISNLVERTRFVMEDLMDEAELEWSNIDKILLVGGSTRMPIIAKMIQEYTGITPSEEINPDEAVAIGAAIQASLIEGNTQIVYDKEIIDVNAHGLGIVSWNSHLNQSENTIILEKNTPLPASHTQTFYLSTDNQSIIQLQITEGNETDIDFVEIIGETIIEFEPKPEGFPIEIEISYDENALVHARVSSEEDEKITGNIEIKRESNLTQKEIDEMGLILSDLEIN